MQQQLQSSYRGDSSDSLTQIMGSDYNPQNYLAQLAQAMLQTGMGSSTQLKTAAMQANAQANRDFVQQQMEMNKARREESKLRAMGAGQLRGQKRAMLDTLGTYMGMLDPSDPFARQEAAAMQRQISGLEGIMSKGGTLEEQLAATKYMAESGLADPTVAGGMVLLQRKAAEAAAREAAMKELMGRMGPGKEEEPKQEEAGDQEFDLNL